MMYFQLRRTSLQRLNNVSLQCLGKQSRIIFLRTAMTAAGSELPERLRRPDAGTNRNAGKFYGKRSLKRCDMPFAPGKGEVFFKRAGSQVSVRCEKERGKVLRKTKLKAA